MFTRIEREIQKTKLIKHHLMKFFSDSHLSPQLSLATLHKLTHMMDCILEALHFLIKPDSKIPAARSFKKKIMYESIFRPESHSNSRVLTGDLNFTSGAELTHTIAKLGLYRDEEHMPVEPSNYAFSMLTRKWSMTRICPFNGNLFLILHK